VPKEKTPLEKYILRQFEQKRKEKKVEIELEKFGKKLPGGGHVWTGADLIRYFESIGAKEVKRKRRS